VHDDLAFLVTPQTLPDFEETMRSIDTSQKDIFLPTRDNYIAAAKGIGELDSMH
jgi:hypothetical protein